MAEHYDYNPPVRKIPIIKFDERSKPVECIPVSHDQVTDPFPARRFTAPGFDGATQVIETGRSDSEAVLDKPLTGNFADMLGQVQEKQKIRDNTKNKRGLGRVTKWLK